MSASITTPGVEEPHYHIVLWHVPKAEEALVAK
jgi:hypothetical protein